ncbi:MAG: SpoIIE family protein phosphatase [Egibacteraceae bacterium]
MGALIASLDWTSTSIGPFEQWPQSLRTAVSICLSSRFPMLIWWGADLVMLYNDACRPILGSTKHPQAMGANGAKIWPEIWHVMAPLLSGVLERGEATWSDDQMFLLDRNGYVEECYFTSSHSPIRGDTGGVGGVFTAITETTERVLSERRLRTLGELAEDTAESRTAEEACDRAAEALARNRADLPFLLLYLLDNDVARLTAANGVRVGKEPVPAAVDLADDDSGWRIGEVATSGKVVLLDSLPGRLACPTTNGRPPSRALVLPVQQAGQPLPVGVLVAGISPSHAFDASYQGFCQLLASHLAAVVASARAYEDERRRAEALAALDRAKTEFFSNASHEFRTPLTLLLGPLEDTLADGNDPLSDLQRERLDVARRNATRLLTLVNALLDFSRLQEGRLRAWYEPTDLGMLTADVASVFRSAVERAGLRFLVDCPSLEPVYVDRSMWERVVLNLVSNALKFTFSGEITVRVRHCGEQAVLEVADTGTGIPAEELPRIFDRFHRIHSARSRTHEGSGVGLALALALTELHGGTIAVDSTVGEGSTFTVSVPLGAAHLPADQLRSPQGGPLTTAVTCAYVEEAARWLPEPEGEVGPSPGGLGGRVLLVDDNADMRRYVTRLLGAYWEVETAGDGLTALEAARRQVPDLVLTDVMMPRMDGFELLRALRREPSTSRVPVVMLSARVGGEAPIEGLDAGADDYLVKPFTARELIARVRANLERARVREEATRQANDHARVLHGLAEAATVLTSAASLDEVLEAVTAQARELIGAHQAVTSMNSSQGSAPDSPQTVTAVSLSDKYTDFFESCAEAREGCGTSPLTYREHRPLRMTQSELESHPGGNGLDLTAGRCPSTPGWLTAPLTAADGSNLGLIQLSDKLEGEFTERDEHILVQLAAIASGRIERARAEDRARHVSATLQQSLLPARLPDLDHAIVAARYLPRNGDVDVGGDWYDVVVMPDGRILLAVGDVVGHGERAAAAMGQLRNALRAYALEGFGPATVLGRLNRLGEALREQHFSTVACLCFDPRTGLLQYANAGHPPPVVLDADGTTRFVEGARGVPIGAVSRSDYTELETRLFDGATLLLYTDGLVESRTRSLDQGLADLADALRAGPADLESLLDHVLTQVPHAARDDDVALVAVRVLERPVMDITLRLPTKPHALAVLRARVRHFLADARIGEHDTQELLVALGEAVANAIVHPIAPAQPFIEVELRTSADEVVATVRDFGQWNGNGEDDNRGRGMPLMEALTDVEIGEHEGGTVVTLRRALSARVETPQDGVAESPTKAHRGVSPLQTQGRPTESAQSTHPGPVSTPVLRDQT